MLVSGMTLDCRHVTHADGESLAQSRRHKSQYKSAKGQAEPEARSYHCMTNNNVDTLYVHAGCPEKGCLSDLWAFNIHNLRWKQLASAPDPPRGGTSIAFADGNLYRMNGFDGKTEQGGKLDVYNIATDEWTTRSFHANGEAGPFPRSVSALLPILKNGKTSLITLFGEHDPSSLGHAGAGKMLADAWSYLIQDQAWTKIETNSTNMPEARGWFDADVVTVKEQEAVVVVGGLGESNERFNDAWLLEF